MVVEEVNTTVINLRQDGWINIVGKVIDRVNQSFPIHGTIYFGFLADMAVYFCFPDYTL